MTYNEVLKTKYTVCFLMMNVLRSCETALLILKMISVSV